MPRDINLSPMPFRTVARVFIVSAASENGAGRNRDGEEPRRSVNEFVTRLIVDGADLSSRDMVHKSDFAVHVQAHPSQHQFLLLPA